MAGSAPEDNDEDDTALAGASANSHMTAAPGDGFNKSSRGKQATVADGANGQVAGLVSSALAYAKVRRDF